MQRTDFIAVNEPLLDGNEKKYLTECIDTGWISSEGPFVEKFELAFSSRVSRKWGIAVCNGTAALDLPHGVRVTATAGVVRFGRTPHARSYTQSP